MFADIELETVDCPICRNAEHRFWGAENGFEAVKCEKCGSVYVRNRPRQEMISASARNGVHQTDDGLLDTREGWRGRKVAHYGRVIARFFRDRPSLTWLDVGAGNGEFVRAVQRTLPAAKVVGIDPMEVKVRRAQARGIPVTVNNLEDVEEKYDVISLINVFSHIPNFQNFGELIRRRLNPGGSLFIETGNGGDLQSRAEYPGNLDLPDHLIFSGVEQMKLVLRNIGFDHIEHFSQRIDHPLWAAKQMLLRGAAGRPKIVLPWTSKFRTVFYRADLPS